jgi:hypothetical protein
MCFESLLYIISFLDHAQANFTAPIDASGLGLRTVKISRRSLHRNPPDDLFVGGAQLVPP